MKLSSLDRANDISYRINELEHAIAMWAKAQKIDTNNAIFSLDEKGETVRLFSELIPFEYCKIFVIATAQKEIKQLTEEFSKLP